MKIGELAERTGLAPSRIRFYESVGLLKMVDRTSNGYRTYPHEAVQVLNLITTAQKAGFTLDELRSLLPSDLDRWDHHKLLETLRRKLQEIEALAARLAESRDQLAALITQIDTKPEDMDCAANARRVLSQMQLIDAPALPTGEVKALGKAIRQRKTKAG